MQDKKVCQPFGRHVHGALGWVWWKRNGPLPQGLRVDLPLLVKAKEDGIIVHWVQNHAARILFQVLTASCSALRCADLLMRCVYVYPATQQHVCVRARTNEKMATFMRPECQGLQEISREDVLSGLEDYRSHKKANVKEAPPPVGMYT